MTMLFGFATLDRIVNMNGITKSKKSSNSVESFVQEEPVEDILVLSETDKKILCDQIIDENMPGTILRDFQTLLGFIQSDVLQVSNGHHLLPLKPLPALNSKMVHPINVDLKRPQPRSYPHIQALYLLLRTTGLGIVQYQNGKPWLIANEPVLQSWEKLNPVERYFTLLEAWLLRGDFKILVEHQGWGLHLTTCLRFLEQIPQSGLQIPRNSREEVRYRPGLCNLAFLELFGLIHIEHGKPLKGDGWRILKLQRIQFGMALLQLIEHLQLPDYEDIVDMVRHCEENPEAPFGIWQPIFKPFFPVWRNNLSIPEAPFRAGVHVFKVSLEQKVWRRIAIPAKRSLADLADAILNVFGFDDDHAYSFYYQNRFGKKVSAGYPEGMDEPAASEILLGDIPLPIGTSILYHYDFGDDWRFDVLLESIESENHKMKKFKLLEKHGEAPEQYAEMGL